ncbi:DEAD/DEAH box helicase [Bifidobacterium stellenboschense]|uniref:ATP-dependent helicase n=1 Tax=Bifidobacterium stellenboschense TaxID=762211 RepID=A0A087D986_9BIFI|nr:DEAD/DEAH box helicase [Bifidobacterium stellenboschense]KFI92086.1 ATP-dependent helicase [Bifidobacterium stellenboschense]
MCEGLESFSEPTRVWFHRAFGKPTEAQRGAWPAIRSGENVLVVAPTGSGKTLAAFLSAIDRLMAVASCPDSESASTSGPLPESAAAVPRDSEPTAASRPRRRGLSAKPTGGGPASASAKRTTHGVRILYISPLKALAVDVAKNLETPLDGIAGECETLGLPAPRIRVATRSGDTTPKERRAIAAHPPDILVTTPESLYLLLTSKARRILKTVDTVIVDEVHALAGTKRGSHLALSLERLDGLVAGDSPVQRIGLSATVNPPAEAARFLGGSRSVTIVNPGSRPDMDLKVVEPLADMHDLSSANVPHRAGGVDTARADAPYISGVTPAMQRLAERKGLAGRDSSTAVVGAAGDRTSGSIWPVVEASVLDEILAHRTTLVFVNSRGLAEKLTARLNDLYAERRGSGSSVTSPTSADTGSPEGREQFAAHYDAVVGGTTQLVGSHGPDDVIAMAHHGSVSKDRRKQIEERLKRGELKCVVATSSLELGIDMGSVDLVIQIAPPLSVASGLQRVGRADHHVGGVSHALLYPLTREQIIGVTAAIESMRDGRLEPLAIPRNPLDVLAQQTVAAAAMDDLDPDAWYAAVRHAAPFSGLDRSMFDAVMGMLTGAYDTEEFSAFRPPLMWNHEANRISARPGAQRLAVTSGGTIPDRGLYTVVLPEADGNQGRRRVGELDEEMVYESRVGDVITLGTSTWQIQEITRDRVVVTPAPGRTARLPFWHGEESGRDAGFGQAKGRLIRDLAAGLTISRSPREGELSAKRTAMTTTDQHCSPFEGELSAKRTEGVSPSSPSFAPSVLARLAADGLDRNAVGNLARLLAEQQAATGIIPSDRTIVVERCPDEEGDQRIIIHSPYGRRVHEPWSMAITTRLKQRYGFDGQAYAADDGIVIRIPDGVGDIPARDLLLFTPDELTRIVEREVGESVLYAARFRECAARSLYLPRTEPGRRVPLWQQRLRAAQLLAAARTRRNFPLLLETARECLQDVYDLKALRDLMTGLDAGTIAIKDAATETPSPFAENLLFGFVGSVMYQYDVPQAERSVRMLSMDPDVLERLLGNTDMSAVLDPDVIAEVSRELAGRTFWNELADDDVAGRVTRYAKTHGPFTADRMIAELCVGATEAVHTLDELEQRGELLHGRFVDDDGAEDGDANAPEHTGDKPTQWLHRDVFRRIRARSLAKAREAIRPVPAAVYQSFLLHRQGVGPVGGETYEGADGLMRVIEQLEGVALPAAVWESSVFPTRVAGYTPAMLDELLAGGEAVWVGSKTGGTNPTDLGLIAFHPADSPLLEQEPGGEATEGESPYTAAILAVLSSGGAYHATQLADAAKRVWTTIAEPDIDAATGEILLPEWDATRFEEALWTLVWQGKVTNSSFAPVRALAAGSRKVRTPARASRRRIRMRPATPMTLGGLWSVVGVAGADAATGAGAMGNATNPTADGDEHAVNAYDNAPAGHHADDGGDERRALELVEILLDRYGVIAQPMIDKENLPGGFPALYPLLKRMEEHGRLARGMFVEGFGAAQFAERETVDELRRVEGDGQAGVPGHMRSPVALSVLDPANLYGSALPWPSAPAGASKPVRREGGVIVLADGRPVSYATPKSKHLTVFVGRDVTGADTRLRLGLTELAYALRRGGTDGAGGVAVRTVTFADVNGVPLNARNPYAHVLHQAGFTPVPQGMRLY